MRILIADDEKLTRYGVVSIIEDLKIPGITIVEVENGKKLVESVLASNFDGVFVDIRMPGMDGLSALGYIKKNHPAVFNDITWFILTGFADFEFARKAIDIGITRYLLKPVSRKEVSNAVFKISELTEERKNKRRRQRELELSGIIGNIMDWKDTTELSCIPFFRVGIVFGDSPISNREWYERMKIIKAVFYQFSGSISHHTCSFTSEGNLMFLESLESRESDNSELFNYLKEQITQVLECPVSIILSPVFAKLDKLRDQVENLLRISGLRHFVPPASVRIADQESLLKISEKDIAAFIEELSTLFQNGSSKQIEVLMLKRPFVSDEVNSNTVLMENLAILFGLEETPLSFDEGIEKVTMKYRGSLNKEEMNYIVKRTLNIIEKDFNKPFGINEIAENLSVTPNYLSSLFKREMGTSFTKYLTMKRLEISRELLVQNGATVKKVATMVGYTSSKHFSKLFKKQFSVLPSEYKRHNFPEE